MDGDKTSIEQKTGWKSQVHFLFNGSESFANDSSHQNQMMKLILMISAPTLIFFSIFHWQFPEHQALAMLQAVGALILIVAFLRHKRVDRLTILENISMLVAMIVFLALFIDGGVGRTGIHWLPIFPFLAFSIKGLKYGWYWVATFIILLAASIVFWFGRLTSNIYSSEELFILIATLIFYGLMAAIFEWMRERRQNDLMLSNQALKEAQLELQQTQQRLEHQVALRSVELEDTTALLKDEVLKSEGKDEELRQSEERFFEAQKMEAIGTLVGGIAHDFNNILSGINANLFMIKREEDNKPDTQKRITDVETLVINGAEMIRQLLTFARKDRVELKNINLSKVVQRSTSLAEVSVPSMIKFRCDISADEILICGNATQLQQVIMNLINNARDALKDVKKPVIHVRFNLFHTDETFLKRHPNLQDSSYAQITIADNGSGMRQDQISNIFEPFYTTKEVGKGTGLGLAMCLGAIQSHGGTIEVNSTQNTGTVFHVYLPLAHHIETHHITGEYEEAIQGQGETILLVDDDNLLRSAHRDVLNALNYKVLEAENGQLAVNLFKDQQDNIDLVIMDIMMPVMDGAEASKQIREIRNDIKLIYATGYDKDSSLGSQVPLDQHILDKPFSVQQLSLAIRQELDLARTIHESP